MQIQIDDLPTADAVDKSLQQAVEDPPSKSSTPPRRALPANSFVVVAAVTLKGITAEEAEVTVTGHLRKDGSVALSVVEKISNKTEALVIEAEAS